MKAGGFDCIIGNPPYIRIQAMKEWAPLEVEIYKELFRASKSGNYDIYVVFVEQGLRLLNRHGRLGFICPHKFFNSQYGAPLREIIAKGKHLSHVVHFGDQQVFEDGTTYTCLLFLDKSPAKICHFVKVDDLDAWRISGKASKGFVRTRQVTSREWNFAIGPGAALFEKLSRMPVKLGGIAERIAQGIRTSANEVYVLDIISDGHKVLSAHSQHLDKKVKLERNVATDFLQGREIRRYCILPSRKVVIIPYRVSGEGMTLLKRSNSLEATRRLSGI